MSEEKSIEESSKPQAASGKPMQSSELKKDNSEPLETKPTTNN